MSVFSKEPLTQGVSYTFGAIAIIGIAVPILWNYQPGTISTYQNLPLPAEERSEEVSKREYAITLGTNKALSPPKQPSIAEQRAQETESIKQQFSKNLEAQSKLTNNAPLAKSLIEFESQGSALITRPKSSTDEFQALSSSESVVTRSKRAQPNTALALTDQSLVEPTRPDQGEEYANYLRNGIVQVTDQAVSTFSADVDTASYSLVRNQLIQGLLPAQQAVRPEEFINYFNYDYPLAESKEQPFKPTISVLDSPWNNGRKLVHIGIKGYDISPTEVPDSNIVFLIDVSGSMGDANKLPLAKQSILFLLNQLKPTDKVSIAVYAGAAGMALEPTDVKNKTKITAALGKLNAGGSTAGGAGIELAYNLAQQNFDHKAVNRIVLLTDGDFNVGQSSNQALLELVERKRKSGVFLSVLGFGRNNYQDDMMQTLAQNGNGVATYIDTLTEAKKVMVDEATSSLFPIAKDVKFQVEFNPATVSDYRLVGYETRALKTEDFNNDKVDAGDIGAGHTVTAIYEITPVDSSNPSVDKPRYADNNKTTQLSGNKNEYGFLKIRYKLPNEDNSQLIETAIKVNAIEEPTQDVRFSIAVAGFSQLLNGEKNVGNLNHAKVIQQAKSAKGDDKFGYRAEFIRLAEMADLIK